MFRKAITYVRGRKQQNQLGRALCLAVNELNVPYSEIVAKFEAEGIRGVRVCKDDCPMARFLRQRLAGFERLDVSVTTDDITVWAGSPMVAARVEIRKKTLSRVIRSFDESLLPGLVTSGTTYDPGVESDIESIRVIDQRVPAQELVPA